MGAEVQIGFSDRVGNDRFLQSSYSLTQWLEFYQICLDTSKQVSRKILRN